MPRTFVTAGCNWSFASYKPLLEVMVIRIETCGFCALSFFALHGSYDFTSPFPPALYISRLLLVYCHEAERFRNSSVAFRMWHLLILVYLLLTGTSYRSYHSCAVRILIKRVGRGEMFYEDLFSSLIFMTGNLLGCSHRIVSCRLHVFCTERLVCFAFV